MRAAGIAGGPPTQIALDMSLRADAGVAHVQLARFLELDQPFTVEMYATPRSTEQSTVNRQLFMVGGGTLGLRQVGQDWVWVLVTDDNRTIKIFAAGAVQPGQRVHLAGVYLPNELRLFLDGKEVGRTPVAGKPRYDKANSPPATLGKGGTSGVGFAPFDGTIDEVRFSKGAKYGAPFTPPPTDFTAESDTLALYHCEEGTGQILSDASGNSRQGRIVGATWWRSPLSRWLQRGLCWNAGSACGRRLCTGIRR